MSLGLPATLIVGPITFIVDLVQHLGEVDGTIVELFFHICVSQLLQEYELARYAEVLAYRTVNFSTHSIGFIGWEILKAWIVVYEADVRVVGVTHAIFF